MPKTPASRGHAAHSKNEIKKQEAKATTLRLLNELVPEPDPNVGVRLWDGTLWPDDLPRRTVIHLKHPGALRAMFLGSTEMAISEAYIFGDFDLEGRAEDVFGEVRPVTVLSLGQKASVGMQLASLPRRPAHSHDDWQGEIKLSGKTHSRDRDRAAVAHHYNASNDFYKLFLDSRMNYSCAYFKSPDDDLETAQVQKLDGICRKLRLQQGQNFLDIGCGWGGLLVHAAREYGVRATGVTLSQSQYEYTRELIAREKLDDVCSVRLQDYRDVASGGESETYDAISSVEMFEHVGTQNLPVFFGESLKLLKPRGAMFIQGSCRGPLPGGKGGPSFINKYVFPDGELIPIPVVLGAAEKSGLEVRHVESLREHFALTLRHWVRRLEDAHEQALGFVNEPTYRVWRLYMAASLYGFNSRRVNLYQAVLARPDALGNSGLGIGD